MKPICSCWERCQDMVFAFKPLSSGPRGLHLDPEYPSVVLTGSNKDLQLAKNCLGAHLWCETHTTVYFIVPCRVFKEWATSALVLWSLKMPQKRLDYLKSLYHIEVQVRHLKRVCVWGRQLPAVLALGIIMAGSQDLTAQRKNLVLVPNPQNHEQQGAGFRCCE